MLFYRVVKHPISEELSKEKEEKDAQRRTALEAKGLLSVSSDGNTGGQTAAKTSASRSEAKSALGKRKLKEPELGTGIEWARTKTSLKIEDNPSIKVADELVSESIQLKADYFKLLSDAVKDDGPSAPIGVSGKPRRATEPAQAIYFLFQSCIDIFSPLPASYICILFVTEFYLSPNSQH